MDCLLLLLLIFFTECHLFNLDTCMTSLLFVQLLIPINICIIFFPLTIHLWNNLPDSIVHSNSLVTFKHSYSCIIVFRMYASIGCTLFHASFAFMHKFRRKKKRKKKKRKKLKVWLVEVYRVCFGYCKVCRRLVEVRRANLY